MADTFRTHHQPVKQRPSGRRKRHGVAARIAARHRSDQPAFGQRAQDTRQRRRQNHAALTQRARVQRLAISQRADHRMVRRVGLQQTAPAAADDMTAPLQKLVTSAEYRITPLEAVDEDALRERVASLLAAERIIKVKQTKRRKSSFDLRPLIHTLAFDEAQPGSLVAHVAAGERGSLRIEDLLTELGLQDAHVNVHRFRLHLDDYYARLRANRNEF